MLGSGCCKLHLGLASWHSLCCWWPSGSWKAGGERSSSCLPLLAVCFLSAPASYLLPVCPCFLPASCLPLPPIYPCLPLLAVCFLSASCLPLLPVCLLSACCPLLFSSCECHPACSFTPAVAVTVVAAAEPSFPLFYRMRDQRKRISWRRPGAGVEQHAARPGMLRSLCMASRVAHRLSLGPVRSPRSPSVLSKRECHHGRQGSFFCEKKLNKLNSYYYFF